MAWTKIVSDKGCVDKSSEGIIQNDENADKKRKRSNDGKHTPMWVTLENMLIGKIINARMGDFLRNKNAENECKAPKSRLHLRQELKVLVAQKKKYFFTS